MAHNSPENKVSPAGRVWFAIAGAFVSLLGAGMIGLGLNMDVMIYTDYEQYGPKGLFDLIGVVFVNGMFVGGGGLYMYVGGHLINSARTGQRSDLFTK